MKNKQKIYSEIIQKYKEILRIEGFFQEDYKWSALSTYAGRPDVNAVDFKKEFEEIRYSNLIFERANGAIKHILREKPEDYRLILQNLFNETIDLNVRIEETIKSLDTLYDGLEKNEDWHKHHHSERELATFLTYKYPDKYAFYKDSFYKKLCNDLDVNSAPAREKYSHYLELVEDFITNGIQQDKELLEIYGELRPKDGFLDKKYKLLAQDILYRIYELLVNEQIILDEGTRIYKLSMGSFSKEEYEKLISKGKVSLHKDTAPPANSKTRPPELFSKANEGDLFILNKGNGVGDVKLIGKFSDNNVKEKKDGWLERKFKIVARAIKAKRYENEKKWWTPNSNTTFIEIPADEYILANELLIGPYFDSKLQLERSADNLHEKERQNMKLKMSSKNVILYGPPGTGKTYQILEMQKKFLGRELKDEDRIEEFVSNLSWWEVIAVALDDIGKASSVMELQSHIFVKEKIAQSKLSKARPGNVLWSQLQSHTSLDSKTVNVEKKQGPFIFDKTKDAKWYLVENWKEQVSDLAFELEQYKTGRLKISNDKRFAMVTFHQSYSYEDFVEGIRPKLDGDSGEIEYEIKKGVFREICEQAENHPDEDYAIFIDEINRGNISKIFGELITLIETDKRISASDSLKGIRIKLPYSRVDFGVPDNLYIIGTMNSVDRSVALVDMALRRRFEFLSVRPNANYIESGLVHGVDLQKIFIKLNQKIAVILGTEYEIGHSYFMNENVESIQSLKILWFSKILPLLQEYFFDDWKKIKALVKGFVLEIKVEGLEEFFLPNDNSYGAFLSMDISDDEFVSLLKEIE